MSNSKLYQPPPAPPKPREATLDPLMALSVKTPPPPAPPPAEELVDLTDDDGLEEWAKGGTRIMSKSPPEPQPQSQALPQTMMQQPSFHSMAYSAPPPAMPKRSSAAYWVVPLALFVLAVGAVMAAGGWYVVHARDSLAAAATVAETATATATDTAPPAVTLTTTSTVAATATATPAPTVTSTTTSTLTSTRRVASTASTSTSAGTGTIRTFAAGNGKPVYVDGKQVGYGGGKIATTCGRHLVAVGSGHAKSVEIPCNGTTITVGSPDGS